MEATEAIQVQTGIKANPIASIENLVQAISVGVFEQGKSGAIATEFHYGVYKIVARYENVSGPPRADISTGHRVFWNVESLGRIKDLAIGLVEENKPFVTKTGDGSLENPVIILRWERENRTCALMK